MAQRLPPGQAARKCKLRNKEQACIRRRIFPAAGRERKIRKCDVCPVGTNRARQLTAHSRRQNAMAVGAAA